MLLYWSMGRRHGGAKRLIKQLSAASDLRKPSWPVCIACRPLDVGGSHLAVSIGRHIAAISWPPRRPSSWPPHRAGPPSVPPRVPCRPHQWPVVAGAGVRRAALLEFSWRSCWPWPRRNRRRPAGPRSPPGRCRPGVNARELGRTEASVSRAPLLNRLGRPDHARPRHGRCSEGVWRGSEHRSCGATRVYVPSAGGRQPPGGARQNPEARMANAHQVRRAKDQDNPQPAAHWVIGPWHSFGIRYPGSGFPRPKAP